MGEAGDLLVHDAFAVRVVVLQNLRQRDGIFKAVKISIECDAGFEDIRVKLEAGIDLVEFCVGLWGKAVLRIPLGTSDRVQLKAGEANSK